MNIPSHCPFILRRELITPCLSQSVGSPARAPTGSHLAEVRTFTHPWETPLSAQAEPRRQACRWVTEPEAGTRPCFASKAHEAEPLPVTPGSLPPQQPLWSPATGGHSTGTAQWSSRVLRPADLRGRPGWPQPTGGHGASLQVSPLSLSWQVSLGLSLPSGSGWGKGPCHWTGHEGRPPHPLQLAGPTLTSRTNEPSGASGGH